MRGKWSGGILLPLLCACGQPVAEVEAPGEQRQPVETRSRVDRAVATTGDVITYTVTVDYDSAYDVELPETGADIAGFRIIDVGSEEPREQDGRRIEERWYKLRADLVGSYVLPPVEVVYRPAAPVVQDDVAQDDVTQDDVTQDDVTQDDATEVEAQSVRTSEIFIEVQSVLPEDGEATGIRGLKPLRQVETPTPWWLWAAAGAGSVLLVLAGALLWRRLHRPTLVPPRPAHEIAYEALARLRQTDFEDVEAMRLFHFEISEVIRGYVEGRFTLNATDLTTEEIAAVLDQIRGLGAEDNRCLRLFLAATDRVKFAAYEPSEDEITGTYEGALSFVEATHERANEITASQEAPEAAAA